MAIKTERMGGFLFPLPADHPSRDIRGRRVEQYRHNLGDGYEVGYKLHVTLSEATYERDRDIIASVLYNGGHDFKMLALKDISGDEDRAFTIYPKKEEDLLNIVASLLKTIQHRKIQPGAGTKTGLAVPGTNGVVTYYTERVNKKVLDDMLAEGAFSERAMYHINRYATPDAAFEETLKSGGYMTSQGWESVLRVDAMKFLFGKGPLDFLWSGDINTELPPPRPIDDDTINMKIVPYDSTRSEGWNNDKARAKGLKGVRCKKCGDYHDKRIECPQKVKVAYKSRTPPQQQRRTRLTN